MADQEQKVIQVRRRIPSDSVDEIADVIVAAFTDLERRSGLKEDLTDRDAALSIANDPEYISFVGVQTTPASSRIVATNFLTPPATRGSTNRIVRGVGPVARLPGLEGLHLGRKVMEIVVDYATNHDGPAGGTDLCLSVDSHNISALCLYLSLGFNVIQEPIMMVQLLPSQFASVPLPPAGWKVMKLNGCSSADESVLDECCDLMQKAAGFSRRQDLLTQSSLGNAWVALDASTSAVMAFTSGVSVVSYSAGVSQSALIAVLSMAASHKSATANPPAMIVGVPIGMSQLLDWALHSGRALKTTLMMSFSPPPHSQPLPHRSSSSPFLYLPSVEM